jgi:hypothetical protein
MALVRKILPFHTMGEDQPSPGISVFHAMFELALQFRGTPVSAEWPWPFGPRKRGQFAAADLRGVLVD